MCLCFCWLARLLVSLFLCLFVCLFVCLFDQALPGGSGGIGVEAEIKKRERIRGGLLVCLYVFVLFVCCCLVFVCCCLFVSGSRGNWTERHIKLESTKGGKEE